MARATDRARAGAITLVAAPESGPLPRRQHPDVSSVGMGLDSPERRTVIRNGCDRWTRAESTNARLRRGDGVPHLSSILGRPAVDPSGRDSSCRPP